MINERAASVLHFTMVMLLVQPLRLLRGVLAGRLYAFNKSNSSFMSKTYCPLAAIRCGSRSDAGRFFQNSRGLGRPSEFPQVSEANRYSLWNEYVQGGIGSQCKIMLSMLP